MRARPDHDLCNDYKHVCPNYGLPHHVHICTDCNGGRFYMAVANRCCKNSLTFSVASALEAYVHDLMGVYNYVDTFLFSSNFIAHETEAFWGSRSFRWKRLPNPFDSTKFPLEEGYDDYALFFGRLSEEKGVDVLLEAARLAPEVRVRVVGDGPEAESLRSEAINLDLTNVRVPRAGLGPGSRSAFWPEPGLSSCRPYGTRTTRTSSSNHSRSGRP